MDNKNKYFDIYSASSLGIVLVACVAIGFFSGFYLDKWLKTSPVFTLVMLFVGVAAGFWSIYKEVTRKNK
ncbi:MAG TPA: hypothetical protein DEE98_06640 [Elusimicrobia bacterium]|nr:MAG: hypothetical protein A2278_06750 [Elusimicrobia bacterium RIFOXYA12_FULL_49_49]OGS11510.1 MAG: hypothetical protein A2386_04060 [Elusimicrobia bacterium RIFOXYB1_FULL_48_9]OGS16257.1 MAG: hypothetical protein A2251_01435 [Elusimicrobia bacterium RIFOXYA2_FULL_47_53]OGS26200.1 MAG: hypothetical protein A2339_02660 [Elusimicrobia bacterium RIFOXYB12_FULL_50_12]OGS31412.1 MAG: hypothetical protein A2323_09725 [Elusimicrobia bacterium RIFOXYB2_FULL_46_23]HBU70048.1 hypothetical protein [El